MISPCDLIVSWRQFYFQFKHDLFLCLGLRLTQCCLWLISIGWSTGTLFYWHDGNVDCAGLYENLYWMHRTLPVGNTCVDAPAQSHMRRVQVLPFNARAAASPHLGNLLPVLTGWNRLAQKQTHPSKKAQATDMVISWQQSYWPLACICIWSLLSP